MSGSVISEPFRADPRGNRLESWTVTQAGTGHVLWLRGPIEAERQILALAPEYESFPRPPTDSSGWTHALRSPEPDLNYSVRMMLDVLTRALSIPSPAETDLAVALDWYMKPMVGVDPYSWPRSEVGELVHSGKYLFRLHPEPQAESGRALTRLMSDVIDQHGLLKKSTIVLDIPGHDSSRVFFGSRLAAAVAHKQNLPMLKVGARSSFRPEAKNLDREQQAAILSNEFSVSSSLHGHSVLIVDDVIRHGGSMAAIAKAARASGARTVYGICAARALRIRTP